MDSFFFENFTKSIIAEQLNIENRGTSMNSASELQVYNKSFFFRKFYAENALIECIYNLVTVIEKKAYRIFYCKFLFVK